MAEIPSIFVQAIYRNLKNWNVEDIIYLSILNTENISKMYIISHVIISFVYFFDILAILHEPRILEISDQ